MLVVAAPLNIEFDIVGRLAKFPEAPPSTEDIAMLEAFAALEKSVSVFSDASIGRISAEISAGVVSICAGSISANAYIESNGNKQIAITANLDLSSIAPPMKVRYQLFKLSGKGKPWDEAITSSGRARLTAEADDKKQRWILNTV
jgi:hypothetical protein